MFKLVLALRYLIKRRITYFAVLAVTLCVFIVVVVMTIMVGLVGDFKDKNHEFVGDCVVGTESLVGFPYYAEFIETLERADFVEAVSPVIKGFGLLNPEDSDLQVGVEILGIDPVRHGRTTGFSKTLHYRIDEPAKAFEPIYDVNLPGCVLGIDLALRRDESGDYFFSITPVKIGFSITCYPLNAKGAPAKAGTSSVNIKKYYYSDTAHTGLARVDSALIYLPLEQMQILCGMNMSPERISAIYIKFIDNADITESRDKVNALWQQFKQSKAELSYSSLLDTVTVLDWKHYRRSNIAPMEKEQAMLIIMFIFVGITTVFIILVVFYMIISHKLKDIGILKSIGASNFNIAGLFAGFAILIGFFGSLFGTLGGVVFLAFINRIENYIFEHWNFQLWNRSIFAIGEIPNRIRPDVIIVIIFSAIISCLIGALLPTIQAMRLRPIETLQIGRD